TAGTGKQLRLVVQRVRRGSPPRRLDRTAAIGRDDEVDPDLVQPLPDLPPGRRATVTEVEVGRGRDREDLGRRGHAPSMATTCVVLVRSPAAQAVCLNAWLLSRA